MTQDEKDSIEQRLDTISATVEDFNNSAVVLGESLLTEKKWRMWFIRIAIVLGVGLLIVGVLLVVFTSKLQNVADRAADQSVSNFNAIQSNQKVLDEIQACNDPLSECSKKRDAFIRLAQDGITKDTHNQIDMLRDDIQNLLIQIQDGTTIKLPTTTTTLPNK